MVEDQVNASMLLTRYRLDTEHGKIRRGENHRQEPNNERNKFGISYHHSSPYGEQDNIHLVQRDGYQAQNGSCSGDGFRIM